MALGDQSVGSGVLVNRQEKPTNWATKAADVLTNILAGKLYNANQLNILVYLRLL